MIACVPQTMFLKSSINNHFNQNNLSNQNVLDCTAEKSRVGLYASLSFSYLWHSGPNYDPSAIIKAYEHRESQVITCFYVNNTNRQINSINMKLAGIYNRS